MEEWNLYPGNRLNKFNMYRLTTIILFLFISVQGLAQTTYTLQQCIDSALAHNIPVKRAGLVKESAEVNWKQARANLLPDLNADLSHGFNYGRTLSQSNIYVNANSNSGGYGLNSNVTLFNGFALQNRIKQNAYGYEASRMEEQQAKDELVLNVILAYLSVLNNEDQVQVANRQAATSQAAVDRLKVMNEQGAVKPSDFADLKGQLMNDQLNILNAKNTLETSKLALSQLMNKDYDPAMRLERINVEDFLTGYQLSSNEVFQKALDQFALVKAVELRKTSAAYSVKAIRGEYFPRLSFGAGINSQYYSNAFTPTGTKIPYTEQLKNNKSTSLGFGVNIPIFNSFFTRNRVKLATILLKDNELVEENTKVQLHQQIDQAHLNMTNAYERYKILLDQVNAYEESFKAAEIRFNAGVGTSIDYLTAKDRLDRANINLVNAKYDFVLRKRILDYYSGMK
jgi:outer membrane protein